ncbi:MAG: hypothetical protein M1837_000898 [Sclerophora amabilis]|nr:MAG: hypothetical protein M1837_000898 [Sclerophora amabilis]
MKLIFTCSSFLLAASTAYAAVNGGCSVSGTPGTCISTANCASGGGKSTAGFCPNDPDNIRCCTKTSCGSGGNCRFTSTCNGKPRAGLCPGPASFQCCEPSGGGGGGGGSPTIPTNKCKAHVISAGKTIVNKFPGKLIDTIYCYANKPGEHGEGRALDFMVGLDDPIGKTIAEWVMNNAASLRVYYIMWNRRIWNVQIDKKPLPFGSWRTFPDRGNPTDNHRDHVHVSFNN